MAQMILPNSKEVQEISIPFATSPNGNEDISTQPYFKGDFKIKSVHLIRLGTRMFVLQHFLLNIYHVEGNSNIFVHMIIR
eukprot:snap_masked-scaffold_46-processed-gene-1.25-mRNA-1 protein AED:1.00 eAED:1.00 QI:0/0/0/0/1/1/2/0/79